VAGSVNSRVFSGITPLSLSALKLLGYVSDAQLRALYENAAAYVFPSLYEGFGIPPLEALALGCPVIASNAAAIPEVCGESAWYFAPDDAQGLARLMHAIFEASESLSAQPPESSARHAEFAKARAHTLQRYSWRAVAKTHLGIISRLLNVS
jgi:glycosyltransferase involved in cell wall biosynthesis